MAALCGADWQKKGFGTRRARFDISPRPEAPVQVDEYFVDMDRIKSAADLEAVPGVKTAWKLRHVCRCTDPKCLKLHHAPGSLGSLGWSQGKGWHVSHFVIHDGRVIHAAQPVIHRKSRKPCFRVIPEPLGYLVRLENAGNYFRAVVYGDQGDVEWVDSHVIIAASGALEKRFGGIWREVPRAMEVVR